MPSHDCFYSSKTKFYFKVTIIQATGIPREYSDVFVQFKLVDNYHAGFTKRYRILLGSDRVFATPPLHNDHQELALGFYHVETVSKTYSNEPRIICNSFVFLLLKNSYIT